MYRYAQIDLNTNICFADSYLSGEVKGDNMILIDDLPFSPLGMRYVEGEWVEVEQSPQPYQPTDSEIIMQSIADIELANIEAQQERQLLAQQLADLELAILEGNN